MSGAVDASMDPDSSDLDKLLVDRVVAEPVSMFGAF